MSKRVAIIDGIRSPFIKYKTEFTHFNSLDILNLSVKALYDKINFNNFEIDEIIIGTVFHPLTFPNLARESILSLGLNKKIQGFTVTRACASGIQAITSAAESILSGRNSIVIAGGTESFSQFSQLPPLKENSTSFSMGNYAEMLAKYMNISREEQDIFSYNSHKKALNAILENKINNEVLSLKINDTFVEDNCIRKDISLESMKNLKTVFDKENGSVTAGNSSPITDGSAITLLMSEEKAKQLNLKPKAYIKSYSYIGIDIDKEMLLSNAYSISKVLNNTNLKIDDIDIFEMHEAFAVQVLATLKALDSNKFSQENLNLSKSIGLIPENKLNIFGGSLAFGHPFGATGIRLINTSSNHLQNNDYNYALLSVCAAGGMSVSMVLEKD